MTMLDLPSADECYQALVARDTTYDGLFVVGVRTTGIFCRPTCPARKPKRSNVEFFGGSREALAAGYRPCRRCRPLAAPGTAPEWLTPLLDHIEADPARRVRDVDLRRRGLDPDRVRRWFRREHDMTFQQYLRARRLGVAVGRIRHGDDIMLAGYDAGWESASAFRDAIMRQFGAPAGAVRAGAAPVTVTRIPTPLGLMLAGATDDGLCLLEFTDRRMLETQLKRLCARLGTTLVPGRHAHLAHTAREVEAYFAGRLRAFTVPLVLPGTEFQRAVWAGLQKIPHGATRSYEELARAIGRPKAVRAVGRANGDNRIAVIVPCHRVIGANGRLTGYGGGLRRKEWLVGHERRSA